LKYEAEQCKLHNPKDYNHIWLGEPLATTSEYLFNFDKLAKLTTLKPFGELYKKQIAVGFDYAAGGGDLCVAKAFERKSTVHWELVEECVWDDPDTDVSVGRTIEFLGKWQPDVSVCDADGLGYPIFCTVSKVFPNLIGFMGGKTDNKPMNAGNNRAGAYLALKEFVDHEWWIENSPLTVLEYETIEKKYKANGDIYIKSKQDMKRDGDGSPDRSDTSAMIAWAVKYRLGKQQVGAQPEGMRLKRVNVIHRGKR